MDIKKLIKKYLHTAHVMEFATCEDNRPYTCSVHYAPDEHFNLYWMSLRSTNHSQRLLKNKKTAAGILIDPDKKICVHLEGEAFELTGEEAEKAHKIYGARYGQKDDRLTEALSGNPKTRAYYIFKPNKLGLFDQKNDHDNPKRAIIL